MMRKVIVLGLDGAVPYIIEDYIKKGKLKNFSKVMEKGAMGHNLPFPSAVTPGNWVSIATGSHPGTNGISDFVVHRPGDPFRELENDSANGFDSRTCQAEFLWDHLSKLGYKSATISYPGSLPKTSKNHIAIGDSGFPGPSDGYTVSGHRCFISKNSDPGGLFDWNEHEEIRLLEPSPWENLPVSYIPAKEAVIEVKADGKENKGSYILNLLLVSCGEEEKMIISAAKDYNKKIDEITERQWSKWIEREFTCNSGEEKCAFRLRMKELSANEDKLMLYLTAIYPSEKFSEPSNTGAVLASKYGPYFDLLEISDLLAGWLDARGMLDEFKRQGMWQANAALEMTGNMEVKAVFTKWHGFDKFYHHLFHKIDPISPGFSEEDYKYYEDIHLSLYEMADEMIGTIMNNMDDDTSLFIVSDHGLLPSNKIMWINNLLARNGFVGLNGEAKYSGEELYVFDHDIIDFKKTKAICYPYTGIWVNLKGRDPEGIVEPGAEYEKVRNDVIKLLKEQKDPENGDFVFGDVFKIEDGGFYGLWGERDADIRFFTNPGYTLYRSNFITKSLDILTRGVEFYSGDHGSCRPTARYGRGSETALFSCIGSGIKARGKMKRPVLPCDIVPTICKLLQIDPPVTSEGSIINEVLK